MTTNQAVTRPTRRRIPTDEELMALPRDGYKRELLNGEIVMSPAGSDHGSRIMRFSAVFAAYVYQHDLGEVFNGQTGFRMKSLDVLSPDVSFVSRKRLLPSGRPPEGFFEGAPDVAVEFLSPGDSKRRLKQKLTQYFENGTVLTWMIDPRRRTAAVHRGPEPDHILTDGDKLCGEDVVPGFLHPVAAFLA